MGGGEEGGQWVLDTSAEWLSLPYTYLFPIPLQAGFQSQLCRTGLNVIEPAPLMLCQANGRRGGEAGTLAWPSAPQQLLILIGFFSERIQPLFCPLKAVFKNHTPIQTVLFTRKSWQDLDLLVE